MKDKCDKYRDWLAREDLTDAEKTELEAHLADCPGCAAFAVFLGDIEAELSAMPEITPDIVGSVMKVVRRTALTASPSLAYGRSGKTGGVNLWPLAGAATLFALVMSGLGAYIAFGGGDAQLINTVAFVNIKTITVAIAIIGSLAVAATAFIYSRMVSVT
jgi:anti-sigma factor RsiW